MTTTREDLRAIFDASLQAVNGKTVVENAFKSGLDLEGISSGFHIVAIGKAADAMFQGVPDQLVKSALVISKHRHISSKLQQDLRVTCIESDHPVPAEASIRAGRALLDFLAKLPKTEACLFLISGGTSALVEVLQNGYTLADLQALNSFLLANDFSIEQINAKRCQLSKIKCGGLWDYLGGRDVRCLMISDVPDDDPEVIASGLLFPSSANSFNWEIIASLNDAKQAAAQKAKELAYKVEIVPEFLKGDAQQAAKDCVANLKNNPETLFVWGGETTVTLPDNPGKGGRNQHLALAAAIEMAGFKNGTLLAAGTDGSDGNTGATGAIVDVETVAKAKQKKLQARDFLQNADSNTFFKQTGELIITGATGTNVMDLVLGICHK